MLRVLDGLAFVDCCRGAGLAREGRILYLGIGRGRFVRPLLANEPGLRLVGLDQSSRPLRRALAALEFEVDRGRVGLHQSDAARLPYRDAAFAAVVSNGLLHHVQRPQELLAEALRVLAPGGVIVVRDLRRRSAASSRPPRAAATSVQRSLERRLLSAADLRRLIARLNATGSVRIAGNHWVWIARKH